MPTYHPLFCNKWERGREGESHKLLIKWITMLKECTSSLVLKVVQDRHCSLGQMTPLDMFLVLLIVTIQCELHCKYFVLLVLALFHLHILLGGFGCCI